MLKKNKQGKYGIKMTPIEPGDLNYWGSDLFKRLEQQVKCMCGDMLGACVEMPT